MIFYGPSNVGKKYTALQYIDEMYQGKLGKRLYSHPDINLIEPDTNTFKLELIKEIHKTINTTPFELDKKFYILDRVDLMNKESANSCLKIFEDCPRYTNFILLADDYKNVLDTIKSRAIPFKFSPIPNLKEYFPLYSDLEIKLMGGCVGNKEIFKDLNLDKYYGEIKKFISEFYKMKYSDILEWLIDQKDQDTKITCDLISIACQEKLIHEESIALNYLLEGIKNFLDTKHLNVNSAMHLRNSVIQARHKASNIN
jgi:DNA polymerase III delta prime subunit